MKRVVLGLVQMAMSCDREENLDKALKMVGQAADRGADVVCLPELFTTTYFPREEHASPVAEAIPGPTTSALSRAARDCSVAIVGGSLCEKDGRRRYNTSVVVDESGRLLGKYRKVHLPQDSHFYEQEYFRPGEGYRVFRTRYGRLGVLICFDQWYPEAARSNGLLGAEVLFYPTAIGTVKGIEQSEGDWHDAWETVQRGHAIANSLVVCAVNRVGREGDTTFWGSSFVSDQFGKVLARADGAERVLVVECDLDLGAEVEAGWGFRRNRRPATYRRVAR